MSNAALVAAAIKKLAKKTGVSEFDAAAAIKDCDGDVDLATEMLSRKSKRVRTSASAGGSGGSRDIFF